MDNWEFLGFVAGITCICAFLPQLFRLIKRKKSDDVSLSTYLVLMATSLMWAVYGLHKHSASIVCTNAAMLILEGIVAVFVVKYKSKERSWKK